MDKFIVNGPVHLEGEVNIGSAKNSVLKLMAASLLVPGKIILEAVPKLNDVKTMFKLLKVLGAKVQEIKSGEWEINCEGNIETVAHYEIVRTMRASVLVLGPLLSRFGKASVSLPGGCAIGTRPIDLHLMGLKALGAKIEIFEGYVQATADVLKGAEIILPFPSVGATENILMAAVYAQGTTKIHGAAKEPEIRDLGMFLLKIFPKLKIEGLGTDIITIQGVSKFNTEIKMISHKPIGDRIEALTMIIAAALTTQSGVKIKGFNIDDLGQAYVMLSQMGVQIRKLKEGNGVEVLRSEKLKPVNIKTAPFPGFPTDAQAQLSVLCMKAMGQSCIEETIFENRFMHIPELARMNAHCKIHGNQVFIEGEQQLTGAPVMCTDLRASAALVIASLIAKGESSILRVYHLDRGYESLEDKLTKLGARIKRVQE